MGKKLLLIHAVGEKKSFGTNTSFSSPPLGLGIVAALTPESWEVTLIDEAVDQLDENQMNIDWDAVGLTSTTPFINRAYARAKQYRDRGIPVILGGVHPTILPDEALKNGFADSVVIGEAEIVWPQVIQDIENKKLRKKYYSPTKSLQGFVWPRRDLFSNRYPMNAIFTSRGCPYTCDFCSVHALYGNHYRQRPFDDILNEWETLNKNLVFIVDENMFGFSKSQYQNGIKLCRKKIERGISNLWITPVNINLAENKVALETMAESGGRIVIIGLESICPEVLQLMNKRANLEYAKKVAHGNIEEAYRIAIDTFHKYGIAVVGCFLFGYDNDPKDIGIKTGEFVLNSELDASVFFTVHPFPGTNLYKRMKKENRLSYTNFPNDWSYYGSKILLFHSPKEIKAFSSDMEKGILLASRRLLSKEAVEKTASIAGKEISDFCHAWNKNSYKTRRFLYTG